MDFFSRALDAEYKSKGIIIQVSENVSTLELIVSYHSSQFISQDCEIFVLSNMYTPVTQIYTCLTVLLYCFLQSVLPFYVTTKLSKIRKATIDIPTPERYVKAQLSTVGLQTQSNGYLPHAIMVRPS